MAIASRIDRLERAAGDGCPACGPPPRDGRADRILPEGSGPPPPCPECGRVPSVLWIALRPVEPDGNGGWREVSARDHRDEA
jgi:hypothetical protein